MDVVIQKHIVLRHPAKIFILLLMVVMVQKSGTSMAAPHVSGAVAVMKEKWPNLTGAQIVDLILSSATDLGASGTDEVYGVGLLNMAGAMTATASHIRHQTLNNISTRIINEVDGVARVVYDITSKPPGTIEWE